MASLFPSSEIFVPNQPEGNRFHKLELPHAFRWMKPEAGRWLAAENIARLSSPLLRITPNVGRSERFLSVSLEGDFREAQRIDRYGSYYYQVPAERANKTGLVEIRLRAACVEAEVFVLNRDCHRAHSCIAWSMTLLLFWQPASVDPNRIGCHGE
jgi:hypothetical protein